MADETQAVVEAPAVAAPEATEAEVVEAPKVEETTLEPARLKTRQELRREAGDVARARAEEAKARVMPERDEGGKFVAEAPVGDDPPAAPAEGEEVATAPDIVTIPLPENHPLRGRGIAQLDGVPKHLEENVRALANATARENDVRAAQEAAQAAREREVVLEARIKALESGKPPRDPKVVALLQEAAGLEAYGPETVELLEAALDAQDREAIQGVEGQARAEVEFQRTATDFKGHVYGTLARRYPIWNDGGESEFRLKPLLTQYGTYLDKTGRQPDQAEFQKFADDAYYRDPRVQQWLTQKRQEGLAAERARIAAEERQKLEEERKAEMQKAAQRHATRPPTAPPTRTHGDAGPPAEDGRVRTATGNRQRILRKQVREMTRGMS